MSYQHYLEILQEEFSRRQLFNKTYSLRAFARDLGLHPARLSLILRKKEGISLKVAEGIAKRCHFDSKRTEEFCTLVGAEHTRGKKQKLEYLEKIEKLKKTSQVFTELSLEYFKVIADWYHFAILELTYLKDFKSDVSWISQKLGLESREVEAAVERLEKLGLLSIKKGKFIDTFKFLSAGNDTPSSALKKFNSQLMRMAIDALYEQDVLEREISSNIFSINKNDIPLFKDRMRTFREDMEILASKASEKDAVYCLGMQFFNVEKKTEELLS